MIGTLWNNKTYIINNYLQLINKYIPDISIIIILCVLTVIYVYMRYKQFNFNHRHNTNAKIHFHNNISPTHQLCMYDNFKFGNIDISAIEAFTSDSRDNNNIYTDGVKVNLFISHEQQINLLRIIQNTYLSNFNQPNIQARNFDTINELLRTYNKCLQPITDQEKYLTQQNINVFINDLLPEKQKFIVSWIPKIQIAKGATWLESGMPHTHSTCIIMRPDWFTKTYKEFGSTTFIHELTHVIQRNNSDIWPELFSKWGFIHVNRLNLTGLDTQLSLNRINPDGMDIYWIWNSPSGKYYWICAIFNSVNPNSLMDVSYLAFPMERITSNNEYSFKYIGSSPIKLTKLTEFQNYFGINENHYHPNEISAQYAEYYFVSLKNENNIKNIMLKPGYMIFSQWMSNIIKLI